MNDFKFYAKRIKHRIMSYLLVILLIVLTISAIIGPKCLAQHTNVAQCVYMNSQTKTIESINKESIILSSISVYR